MKLSEKSCVGELVAEDYRTAEVFTKHKIDFCCKGGRSLEAVCEQKQIDVKLLIKEIETVSSGTNYLNINFSTWPLDLLVDYIEKKHHRYVEQKTPLIQTYLKKIVSVHGQAHPELSKINTLFNESAKNLAAHMKKEELILFPYIRKIALSEGPQTSMFGSINNPITQMKNEHNEEGERFSKMAELSNNYTPPADACSTYTVTLSLLQEFESDLHHHIHLENNILFPAAIIIESSCSR